MIATADASKTRRLEMILRQLEAMPTLPAIATRLLMLTSSDDSSAKQVIELISGDQSLTAKVLSMARAASLGSRDVTTVDKAVVLLGFDAIRNAVLSIKVIEMFHRQQAEQGAALRGQKEPPSDRDGALPDGAAGFDFTEFWRHCLAVAVAAERIAAAHHDAQLPPGDAFVCGLLHDIGKLALEHVLPKSYERVIELVEINQSNIAEFERRIIGMDHHTAGKRLAEQWQLPHVIQDCIWLHGAPYESVPQLGHRRMVGLITLADLVARGLHIGFSGNRQISQDRSELAKQIGLDPAKVEQAIGQLPEQVALRAKVLGLDDAPSQVLLLKAIQQANDMLGKLNGALSRKAQACARQQQVLESITTFHGAAAPGQNVEGVIGKVVASAVGVLGRGYFAVIHQLGPDHWQMSRYNEDGRLVHGDAIDAPPATPSLSSIDASHPELLSQMSIVPHLADYLGDEVDVRQVRLLPLGCSWGTAAILVHDRAVLPPSSLLTAVTTTWGSAIAAAIQHDGARRLGEQLADANHALAEAQEQVLRNESLARLGEMAAGAAHEMNNPLAVISGRAQLLLQTLTSNAEEWKAARTIVEQAHRVSDLITALRLYAEPPKANRRPTDITAVLDDAVKALKRQLPPALTTPISLQIRKDMPTVWIDPTHVRQIVIDLMLNAIQAAPKTGIHVNARVDPTRQVLVIQVSDDGHGMDEHTLSHAFDPFFSNRHAGRGVGMGLPRAQQLAATHQGKVDLRSTPGGGTLATVTLPLDSPS